MTHEDDCSLTMRSMNDFAISHASCVGPVTRITLTFCPGGGCGGISMRVFVLPCSCLMTHPWRPIQSPTSLLGMGTSRLAAFWFMPPLYWLFPIRLLSGLLLIMLVICCFADSAPSCVGQVMLMTRTAGFCGSAAFGICTEEPVVS